MFAQGLAAAAPSVAVAVVPFSLFVAAGKGAAWAVLVGLAITILLALTISFQAKRTVSSGSLGTYTGNGLGPGFAYAAGFSLLLGYIGFATTGTLGGVLYLDSFLEAIGLGSDATWFKLLLVVVVVAAAVYLPYRGAALAAKYELAFELVAIVSILVIIVGSYRRLRRPDRLGAVESRASGLERHLHRRGDGRRVLRRLRERGVTGRRSQGRPSQHRPLAASRGATAGVLYVFATYPQILFFGEIDGDKAVLPQLADTSASAGSPPS